MLLRALVLGGLVTLLTTGCASRDAEEPFTPVSDGSSYNAGYSGTSSGYTGNNVYAGSSGGSYQYQGSYGAPTPQRAPGGVNDYAPGEFSDYTEEQAQTWTSVSSDGSVTTVNRTTGETVGSQGGTASSGSSGYVGSGQTYVVAKGDTLFQLARRFYQNESRWRDIWNANRARVPNKDRLPVGIKLIIP